ncbi:polyamine ABC transporter substrate-binding protein [Nocardioides dongkuii]|uniref:polyamine ABC transporter substrate-binding protein n=1 Tax=Nocardioides dongkuii TaxID=2760089 RepID=UPI001FD5A64C|nr:spermidine/putrescine ABC transporter substrate-binding protein [Nocardioides dongkuii]
MFRGVGAVAFAGASVGALKLPFFATEGAQQDPASCRAGDLSSSEKELVVSNWPQYIDPRKKATSTLSVFQERTGISVDYSDDVNDNAEFYAKVRNQMGDCQSTERDMVMLTDWMAARMIGLGWIQPLDKAKVPNLHANLIEPLRGVQWDPDLEFHAPWQTGLTGIAYNAAKTGEVRSFEELLTRPDLKGRVTLLSEMRDTMAFMLRVEGADPDQFSSAEWGQAIDRLRQVVSDGQVRAFTGNDYTQDLAAGNIHACEAWSGDVIQLQFENPDIRFVAPEEGLSLWSDNMLVPNLATHQDNAEAWIDYYYEPEVAAKLAAWVNYICPVQGAREEMEKIDPSLVDNKLIFPDDEMLATTFDFMPLDDRQSIEYEGDWANVTGG